MKILHTADWQLGKPYARIEDPDKRALARRVRLEALEGMADVVRREGVALVVVAGDVFDAPTVDQGTVLKVCEVLRAFAVPVVLLPGNHDHGGPGSVWHQAYWRAAVPDNVVVALEARRYDVAGAAIFACPLLRQRESHDTTRWLRDGQALGEAPPDAPRVIVAHGGTQAFGGADGDDEEGDGASNVIEVGLLPDAAYDYLALGDWHGTKQLTPKAWYAGTHEPDRFPKGEAYDAGNVLVADVVRGTLPRTDVVRTGRLSWRNETVVLHGDESLAHLQARLQEWFGGAVDRHLLRLTLTGGLGLEATTHLETLLEHLRHQLVRLRLHDRLVLEPGQAELHRLTARAEDPTIAAVAGRLVDAMGAGGVTG